MESKNMIAFVDGASKGNPGPGGYGGVILINQQQIIELGAHVAATTNNRMELQAVCEVLSICMEQKLQGPLKIYSDSQYVCKGLSSWLQSWKARGWKTAAGGDVVNQDLWKTADSLKARFEEHSKLQILHVRGHAGIPGNERADTIASSFAEHGDPQLFSGSYEGYKHDLLTLTSATGASEPTNKKKVTKSKPKGKAYSYISLVGGVFYTDKTWTECERRVKGKSGVKFQKVFSKQQEDEMRQQWQR